MKSVVNRMKKILSAGLILCMMMIAVSGALAAQTPDPFHGAIESLLRLKGEAALASDSSDSFAGAINSLLRLRGIDMPIETPEPPAETPTPQFSPDAFAQIIDSLKKLKNQ